MNEEINNHEHMTSYDIKTDNYKDFKKSMIEFLELPELDESIDSKEILFRFPCNLRPFAERFIADNPDINVDKQENEKSTMYNFVYKKLHLIPESEIERRLIFLISEDISEMSITVYYIDKSKKEDKPHSKFLNKKKISKKKLNKNNKIDNTPFFNKYIKK